MKALFGALLFWCCIGFVNPVLAQHSDDSTIDVEYPFLPISQKPDSLMPRFDGIMDGPQAMLNYYECDYSKRVDSVLNKVYRTILNRYSGDPTFIGCFKRAEAAWLKYRDAELLAILGGPDTGVNHGSMSAMCECQYRSALTRERIGELLMWLQIDETDQTGCDTFYPESLLQTMRSDRKHHRKK